MKTIFAFLMIYLLQLNSAFGQVPDDVRSSKADNTIYTTVEVTPTFPGGIDSLKSYLKQNVVYPELYRKFKYKEWIFIKFVVEKDGSVSNANLINGGFKEFEKEALRLVGSMPKWNPGTQNGKPLRVYLTMPVKFCPEGCTGW